MYNWTLSHPQIVYRAKALDEWYRSGAYQKIVAGNYPLDATGKTQLGKQVKCGGCGGVYAATMRFCPKCRTDLQAPAPAAAGVSASHCRQCNVPLPGKVAFCPRCSAPAR